MDFKEICWTAAKKRIDFYCITYFDFFLFACFDTKQYLQLTVPWIVFLCLQNTNMPSSEFISLMNDQEQ